MKWQQYFLRDLRQFRSVIGQVETGRAIEFGVGDGAVTQVLLSRGWHVKGWEIDSTLKIPVHENLSLHVGDFTKADFSFLAEGGWWLISAPPYDELPFIRALIERYSLPFVLLVPHEALPDFRPYQDVVSVDNTAFEPHGSGEHAWILRRPRT